MPSPLTASCPNLLSQGAMLLLSCLDDALIVLLSQLGIPLPGEQWWRPILLTLTGLLWLYRLARCCQRSDQPQPNVMNA